MHIYAGGARGAIAPHVLLLLLLHAAAVHACDHRTALFMYVLTVKIEEKIGPTRRKKQEKHKARDVLQR